jgi:adenine-specific DNA-methyltransferase
LCYAKKVEKAIVKNIALNELQENEFDKIDENGRYRYLPFRRSGGTSTPEERPNSEFSLYYSKNSDRIIAVGGERNRKNQLKYEPQDILSLDEKNNVISHIPSEFNLDNQIIEIMPIDIYGKRRVWRWSDRKAILEAAKNDDFKVIENKGGFTVQLKDRIKEGRKSKTIWTDSKYDASSNGTILLKNLFDGEKLFSYPKSLHTVKDTLLLFTDSKDIILDFFAGSGTTAHAVLDLNKEDGGSRKFIMIEQMDYVETVTSKRVQKVIQQNDDGDFVYLELKKFNQSFIEQIEVAADTAALMVIWEQMKERSFLNYNVDIKKQDEHMEAFKALSLAEQKKHLCEILDKNQLYVNISSLEDTDFSCTEEEKKVTKAFYQTK